MKLNLGAGDQKIEGYQSVDVAPECKPDFLLDITKFPWPWEENSIDGIMADNIMEHIEPKTFIKVMNECHRILKPGCQIWIRVPHIPIKADIEKLGFNEGDYHKLKRVLTRTLEALNAAFTDPTHLGFFTPQTFDYWNEDHTRGRTFGKSYGIKSWKLITNAIHPQQSKFLIVELQK